MARTIKPCKEPGCNKLAHSRQMCKPHYNSWYEKNKATARRFDSAQAVLDAMPGTLDKLSKDVGMCYEQVRRIVARLRTEKRCHVGDWREPLNVQGSSWLPIFHEGKGTDKVVSAEVKAARTAARARVRCIQNHRKRTTGTVSKPPKFAALLAPLGV